MNTATPEQSRASAPQGESGPRKRRRKKPTLNCSACVARKTRCDRSRPRCTQCVRRQSPCGYSEIANIIQSLGPERPKQRHSSIPADLAVGYDLPGTTTASEQPFGASYAQATQQAANPKPQNSQSEVPWQNGEPTAIHAILNADDEHPFHNYWTRGGGLPEVVNALPAKEHAFSLVAKFFDSIDPLYPVVSRTQLIAELEAFWSLSQAEMYEYEAAKLALHFVIYAVGVQSAEDLDPEERSSMADFYLSASHQCLCLCSYLNRFTFGTMQTMILIGYFLINTHRFWEAWTFSGILVRQAYGSQLHRSPATVSPDAPSWEKQLRRVLWQAITVQDVNLAFYLQLPPSAVNSNVDECGVDPTRATASFSNFGFGGLATDQTATAEAGRDAENDVAYLRSFCQYATFVQENVCIPVAHKQPISKSPSHRATLIARFRDMYSNWQAPFDSLDSRRFEAVGIRLARQLIAVSSNFFGVLAVLYMDEDPSVELYPDIYGAIEATHEALSAFFALLRLCPAQVDMWGSYHTRAYSQAVRIGNLLVAETQQPTHSNRDPRLMLAKSDLDRYLDLLRSSRGSTKHRSVQAARYQTLRRLVETINVG